jgi:alpha-beta hydrolase superfamily lysophospholipase
MLVRSRMSAWTTLRSLGKHSLLFIAYALTGALITILAGFIWLGVSGKPELKPWHTAVLNEEFTRADSARIRTLQDYRKLEERLFAELRREVYERIDDSDRRLINRYSTGSRADPMALDDNANRTLELSAPRPRAGVILVHGLTDSPYVFRALALRLHERGCWVVALRLPGHGTAPAALTRIDWRDWGAALRLAARDLRQRLPENTPLYFMGFSTGAALSVEYSLARLEGEDLPRVDGLVLLSPAIGVDPLAWLAIWQKRLSGLPGLGKMAWLDLVPEYDPYKYNSFPVEAGHQIYTLTQVIDERMTRLAADGPIHGFPRTLVFQSVADATVSPLAVVQVFMGRLAPEGHELVLFDVNRRAEAQPLLRLDARLPAERLLYGAERPFGVTLITNENESSSMMTALYRPANGTVAPGEPTGFAWPTGMFSLSHLALPVSPQDPVYGAERPPASKQVYLGRAELLGEQGLLAMPTNALVRLRFNPFFADEERRIEEFLALSSERPVL